MFKKVLVADDLLSINQGVLSILKTLNINNIQEVQYCDDAYLKIKRANFDNKPIDLLITDLSYKKDHRNQKLNSGEELISVLHNEFPNLKNYSLHSRRQTTKSKNLIQLIQYKRLRM